MNGGWGCRPRLHLLPLPPFTPTCPPPLPPLSRPTQIIEADCDPLLIKINEDDIFGDGNNYEVRI